jgi:hypothetical protein
LPFHNIQSVLEFDSPLKSDQVLCPAVPRVANLNNPAVAKEDVPALLYGPDKHQNRPNLDCWKRQRAERLSDVE